MKADPASDPHASLIYLPGGGGSFQFPLNAPLPLRNGAPHTSPHGSVVKTEPTLKHQLFQASLAETAAEVPPEAKD